MRRNPIGNSVPGLPCDKRFCGAECDMIVLCRGCQIAERQIHRGEYNAVMPGPQIVVCVARHARMTQRETSAELRGGGFYIAHGCERPASAIGLRLPTRLAETLHGSTRISRA